MPRHFLKLCSVFNGSKLKTKPPASFNQSPFLTPFLYILQQKIQWLVFQTGSHVPPYLGSWLRLHSPMISHTNIRSKMVNLLNKSDLIHV